MKFARAAAKGRGQMRERHRRDRMATPSLGARYPQYECLRLEFVFKDVGPFTPAPQVAVMHPPANAYFAFPCPYEDCDGEFDLAGVVATMAQDQQERSEGRMPCPGHRNRGETGRAPCQLSLEFRISAQKA